jgi:hypothetical protein
MGRLGAVGSGIVAGARFADLPAFEVFAVEQGERFRCSLPRRHDHRVGRWDYGNGKQNEQQGKTMHTNLREGGMFGAL